VQIPVPAKVLEALPLSCRLPRVPSSVLSNDKVKIWTVLGLTRTCLGQLRRGLLPVLLEEWAVLGLEVAGDTLDDFVSASVTDLEFSF